MPEAIYFYIVLTIIVPHPAAEYTAIRARDSHRSLRSCTHVPWYNAAMTGDVQLIDTHMHLHLAEFDADREAAIARARAAQVTRLVEVGYDLESSRAALELAAVHPSIYAVVGIQPHYAALANTDWLDE